MDRTCISAMQALIAHSPRAREELNDKFDAKFLQQQAELVAHMDAYPEHYSEVRRP